MTIEDVSSIVGDDAQAELNKLFGIEQPLEDPEESAAAESDDDLEVEEEETLDPDTDTDEESVNEDDSEAEEPQAPAKDIEYIKANGKKVKVDFNDRESIKRVYSLAAGARQWQAERDDFKSKYEAEKSSAKEVREAMEFLENIKDNHEDVFEAVTGVKLEDKFRSWAEELQMLTGLTESEKQTYLSNQEAQRKLQELDRREKDLQRSLEKREQEAENARRDREASIANPIYFQYNFDGELGDSNLESRFNRMLWGEVKSELDAMSEVTPDVVKESFSRISNQIRKGFKNKADTSVKKAVRSAKKQVKAKAQDMAIRPKRTNKAQEISDKIATGDLAGLLSGDYDLTTYKG